MGMLLVLKTFVIWQRKKALNAPVDWNVGGLVWLGYLIALQIELLF